MLIEESDDRTNNIQHENELYMQQLNNRWVYFNTIIIYNDRTKNIQHEMKFICNN